MRAKAEPETVVLKLEDQISKAAGGAMNALGRLENQIMREQNALARMDKGLVDARLKLDLLAQGSVDNRAVAAYEKQARAVETLRKQVELGKKSGDDLLAAMQKLSELKPAAEAKSVDVAAYHKQENAVAALSDRLGAQKDKIAALHEKLAGGKAAGQQFGEAVKFAGDQAGISNSKIATLASKVYELGPYGAIAAISFLALGAAVTAVVAIWVKGITAAGQMRSELLKLQAASVSSAYGFSWLFNASHESTRAANMMEQAINRVNASSAVGRDKLADYAVQIRKARFEGKNFDTVLQAMSTAASGGTEQMAQDVLMWARQMRFMSGSVDTLATRVEQKLGRTAKAAAISLDVQFRRLGENIRWIFGGADIDPMLRALNSVLSLFNAGSKSATGMRDAVTSFVERGELAILRLGIKLVQIYIWLRKHEWAWNLIKYSLYGVGAVFATFAAIATAAMIGLGVAVTIVTAPIWGLGIAIAFVRNHVKAWWAELKAFGASVVSIGSNIISGIATGILSAGDMVWDALKEVVGGAVDRIEKFLKIGSDSKLFIAMGGHIGGGLATGQMRAAPIVERASLRLGMASVEGASAGIQAAPIMAPTMSFGIGAGPNRYQSSEPQRQQDDSKPKPAVSFHGCNFGSNSEESIREAVHKAWAEEALNNA